MSKTLRLICGQLRYIVCIREDTKGKKMKRHKVGPIKENWIKGPVIKRGVDTN